MNLAILANILGIFIGTIIYPDPDMLSNDKKMVYWTFALLPFYIFEFCIQILGFGPFYYFTEEWCYFDFIILLCSTFFLIVFKISPSYTLKFLTFLIVVRTVHLLRILNAKKSFRRIFSILALSFPDLIRFFVSLGLAFYVYAIIGMSLYGDVVKQCSFNSEGFPQYNSKCGPNYDYGSKGLYYLINFEDIFHSFITLFILMIGGTWDSVADGYVAVTSPFSYLFFMFFYLFIVLVVTNVTTAFVLQLYNMISTTLGKSYTVRVSIGKNMLEKYDVFENIGEDEVEYVGRRSLGQIDSLMLLYQSEDWVQKDEISPIGDFYVEN